jgi:hypothetical protein
MTTAVHCPDDGARPGNAAIRALRRQPLLVGIDIKGIFCETRDQRANEPGAARKHQPVVAERRPTAGKQDPMLRPVNVADFGFDAGHANGAHYVVERNAGAPELRLVIAYADRMKGAAVDQRHRNPVRPDAELVELAGGTDRRPQPGKPGPEHNDALHRSIMPVHMSQHGDLIVVKSPLRTSWRRLQVQEVPFQMSHRHGFA